MPVRLLLVIAALSVAGCLCCGDPVCSLQPIRIEVKDATGAPVASFSGRAGAGTQIFTFTCPGDTVCTATGVSLPLRATTVGVVIDGGTVSANEVVTVDSDDGKGDLECPGCPLNSGSVTLR